MNGKRIEVLLFNLINATAIEFDGFTVYFATEEKKVRFSLFIFLHLEFARCRHRLPFHH